MTVEGKLGVTVISTRSSQACSRLSCYDSIVEVVYSGDTVWTSSPSKRRGALLQWGESFSLSTRKDAPDELQLRLKSVAIISHKTVHATVSLKEVFVSGSACPIVQLLSKDGKERGELFLQLAFVSAFKLMRNEAEASDAAVSAPVTSAIIAQSPLPSKAPHKIAVGFQPLGSGVALYHTPPFVPPQCTAPRSNNKATSALRKSIAHRICSPADCTAASVSDIEQQIREDADLARHLSGSAASTAVEEPISADADLARKISSAACKPSGSHAQLSNSLLQPQTTPAAERKNAKPNSLAKESNPDTLAQQRTPPAETKAVRSSGMYRPLSASQVGRSCLRSFSPGRRWSSESGSAPRPCSSQEIGPCRQSSASGSLERREVCSAPLGQAAGLASCTGAASKVSVIDALLQDLGESRACKSVPGEGARGHCAPAIAAEGREKQPKPRHPPAVSAAAVDDKGSHGHELQNSRGVVESRCPTAQQLSFKEPGGTKMESRCPARRQLSFWGPDVTCVAEARKELGGLVSGSCKTQLEIDILQATSMCEDPSAPPLPEEMWSITAYR